LSRHAGFESNLQSSLALLHAPYQHMMRAALADPSLPQRRALDLGCGAGDKRAFLTPHLMEDGLLVGVDSDRAALVAARLQHDPRCAWLLGDAMALPCGDASFDRCWCIAALHVFGNTAHALREMRRVLRPGGDVVILLVERRWVRLRRWSDAILAAAQTCQVAPADGLGDDLLAQLGAAGFAELRLRAYGLGIADDDPQRASLALTDWLALAPQLPNDPALHAAGVAADDNAEIDEIAVLFVLRGCVRDRVTR
jgi:SAM-dependent methyltransferase